jgi:isoquinoline 1-oxidoreductase alpha subunit
MAVSFTLNGHAVTLDADPQMPLLWAIRDEVGLTGTKYGCGMAQCGACTVHLDGEPVRSCSLSLGDIAGKQVVTIEGVGPAAGPVAQAVKDAWRRIDVVQCGYCQSGQIMSAVALLKSNRRPSDADIDAAMAGNACRCATYVRIRAAIHEAARSLGA